MTRNQIEFIKTRNQAFKDKMDVENATRMWQETNRHNIAQESENSRHNRSSEGSVALQTAINQGNLELHRSVLAENQRHNMVSESLGYANLGESRRSNMAQEAINKVNAAANTMNANTNQLNAETREYAAINDVNRFLDQRKLNEQSRKESEARQKYYEAQTGTSIPVRAIGDVINALDTVGRLALLFN